PDTTLAPPSLPHGSAVMAALRVRRPPIPTLFPYTTLFRSLADEADDLGQRRAPARPRHAEAEGARPVDRPPDDGLARPLFYRQRDRKSTRLNSSHVEISYAVRRVETKTNLDVAVARHRQDR